MMNNDEDQMDENEDLKSLAYPYAYFSLYGESIDPDLITEVLGVLPDMKFKKGDPDGKKGRVRPIGFWSLSSSDIVKIDDLQEHIVWVLDQLEPAKDKLMHFISQEGVEASFKVVFNLFVHEWDDKISSTLIKRISDLNAHFEISIYYLEDLNERLFGDKP